MIKHSRILFYAAFVVCVLLIPSLAWAASEDGLLDSSEVGDTVVSREEPSEGDSIVESEDLPAEPPRSEKSPSNDPSAIEAPYLPLDLGGLCVFSNKASGKVLDVVGGSAVDGANVQQYSDNNSPAQRYRIEAVGDGYFYIVNIQSGKVLDVAGGVASAGTNVWQYERNGSAAQKWKFFSADDGGSVFIVSALSGEIQPRLDGSLVLDVFGGELGDGGNIQIYTFNGTAAQKFSQRSIARTVDDGVYEIGSNLIAGKGLSIEGWSTADFANVQMFDFDKSAAQRFRVTYDEKTGYYSIVLGFSGKSLDVAGASVQNGANVQQYAVNGSAAQKWSIELASNGSCVVRSGCSGKVLDVQWGSTANGANIWMYESNGSNAQLWFFVPVEPRTIKDGTYSISSVLSGNPVLDVVSGSVVDGANVQIFVSNGSAAQKFEIEFHESVGYYSLRNVGSGKMLDVSAAGISNGTNVQQYGGNGSLAQFWAIDATNDGSYVIRSACNGLALDVANGNSTNGTNVHMWAANGTAAQGWRFSAVSVLTDGVYEIRSALGPVLDALSGGEAVGTNVQVYSSNNTLAQKYQISLVVDGYYKIECLKSGLVVGLDPHLKSNVCLVEYSGTEDQLWAPSVEDGGYIVFENKSTGHVLDVANGDSKNGANVQIYKANGSSAQKWTLGLTDVFTEGLYVVSSGLSSDMVLDIANGSAQNGALLQLYNLNSTAAQKFRVTKVSDGLYQVANLASSKVLDVVDSVIDPVSGLGSVQQWESGIGNRAQLWRFEYAGGGRFSLFSVLGDGTSCLDVYGAQISNGTPVGVYRHNGSLAQQFKFSEAGVVTYVSYPLTLSQMVSYQKSNPYLGNISDLELRTALDPSASSGADYMQFSDLRYYSGLTGAQLDKYIGTNGSDGVLAGKGSIFVDVAQRYGINEAYLVAHTCLESGWGKSLLATGADYNGQGYWYRGTDGKQYWANLPGYEPGRYYNLFGIGAIDSDPHKGGIETAIKNKWNSVDAAIDGSASWIASGYIYRSIYPQYTLYDMKWDTSETVALGDRGWHQYATDVQWAKKIARLMNSCYTYGGVTDPSLTYVVPRYL